MIAITFKQPIHTGEVASQYGKLVEGLNWNMNENMEVVGIYFEEKDRERLYKDIHKVLWFFDELEEHYIFSPCPKCNIRIGSHSIMESYRCGLMTKEQTREALTKLYG